MQDPTVSIAMTEKSGIPICNTSPVVCELLETQERCFKATMQMLINSIREEVKDIRKFVVKKAVKKRDPYKVKINPESMVIERVHRLQKRRDPFHHLANGTKVKSRPRPIVANFLSWKNKDRVLRSARSIKPDGTQFLENFSKRTIDKRKEKTPEFIAAHESGKRAVLVMDKIIIANNTIITKNDLILNSTPENTL